MSDWLDYLGDAKAAPPPSGSLLVVGDDPALIGKARELAEVRGSYLVVAAPEPNERMFHLGAHVTVRTPLETEAIEKLILERGADVVLGPQSREAAGLLGRLAQRTGGGLVRCREATIDTDSGDLVCRTTAYGGRVAYDVVPVRPGFALLDVGRLPEPLEDRGRSGTAL